MNELENQLEKQLLETAASFPYPPTPDVATAVRQRLRPAPAFPARRLAYALLSLLLLAALLLAVPVVRATLADLFRLGAMTVTVAQQPAVEETADLPLLATELTRVATPVTLAEAANAFRHPLLVSPVLGEPDAVWHHQGRLDETVVLAWRDAADPEQVRYSLYQIDARQYANKLAVRLQETSVDGDPAFWIEGPHIFQLENGRIEQLLLVDGSVLVWWAENVTYRLEGARSMEEAIEMAESLRQVGD